MDTIGRGTCKKCKTPNMPLYGDATAAETVVVNGKKYRADPEGMCFDCAHPAPTVGQGLKGIFDLVMGTDSPDVDDSEAYKK